MTTAAAYRRREEAGQGNLLSLLSGSAEEYRALERDERASASDCDVSQYDRTIIALSGGKDSIACLLWAIENNCPAIELWHHWVDGKEGSTLMDWAGTPAYCEAIAKAFNLPLYASWLEGGFEREMNKTNDRKAKTWFETPDDLSAAGGKHGMIGTRRVFPQKSADLSVRWCSAYLKVDVCKVAIKNQKRFEHGKTLLITGERAEESAARAKYKTFEPDQSDTRNNVKKKRHVDRLRPIHGWVESEVWAIIKKHGVVPHDAYRIGWGRLSCFACIFGSPNQWATIRAIAPERFEAIANYESEFGKTIDRKKAVTEIADRGTPYTAALNNPELVARAMSEHYTTPVIVDPRDWILPAGAYAENAGPI